VDVEFVQHAAICVCFFGVVQPFGCYIWFVSLDQLCTIFLAVCGCFAVCFFQLTYPYSVDMIND
jgi:hypothetical protein